MRDTTLLGLRLTLGGYLAAHGAQKLFGAFGGRGLEASAEGFDRVGLVPGRSMVTVGATTELAGDLPPRLPTVRDRSKLNSLFHKL